MFRLMIPSTQRLPGLVPEYQLIGVPRPDVVVVVSHLKLHGFQPDRRAKVVHYFKATATPPLKSVQRNKQRLSPDRCQIPGFVPFSGRILGKQDLPRSEPSLLSQ